MLLDLCHTIRTEQGVKVTVEVIFEHPTISDLVRYINNAHADTISSEIQATVREVEPVA